MGDKYYLGETSIANGLKYYPIMMKVVRNDGFEYETVIDFRHDRDEALEYIKGANQCRVELMEEKNDE